MACERVEDPETHLQEDGEVLRVTRGSIGEVVLTADAVGPVTFLNSVAEPLTGSAHANDIVGRKMDAKAVAISEIRYRRLFETAQDAILILDAETGTIFDANPFLVELLGYSLDELMGKELWEIGLFQDREANRSAMR